MTATSHSDDATAKSEVLCITGGPHSGKTAALVERAAAWGRERSPQGAGAALPRHLRGEAKGGYSSAVPQNGVPGFPPGGAPSFLFFCASPAFTSATEALLAERGATSGLVTTLFDYALRVLAHPRARAVTGRSPRVLTADEQAVFFEDLKTSGLKRGRLRELWAFLLCGLANLDDGDPAWIQTTEERAQLDLALDILRLDDALLPGEVVNLAVRALEADAVLREAFAAPLVLADDVPLMSRASQRLAELLGTEKLAIAGDATPLPAAFEPYPNPHGMDELCDRHRPVQVVTLDEPFPKATREWQTAETLSDEMRLVATTVADELAQDTAPASIAVVATHPLWRANLVRALQMAGIPATEYRAPSLPILGKGKEWRGNQASSNAAADDTPAGRSRAVSPERHPALGNASGACPTLQRLAADPSDSVAWRQWLAGDDALARSAAVSELRRAAAPEGLTLAEALPRLAAGQLPDLPAASPFAQSLIARYEEARRLLGEKDLPAEALHSAPGPRVATSPQPEAHSPNPAEHEETGRADEDPTAAPGAAWGAAMPLGTDGPGGDENIPPSAVTVCAPRDLAGRTFDVIIFGGFVNGFIPAREMCDPGVVVGAARERALAADHAALNAVTTRATRRILFTGFTTCDLETAEHLKLHIARIRLTDGRRQCTIEPSVYLEELGLS